VNPPAAPAVVAPLLPSADPAPAPSPYCACTGFRVTLAVDRPRVKLMSVGPLKYWFCGGAAVA
jgi:hypothetical protein